MSSDIILIGPIGSGKSTLGELIAERLGVPQVTVDDLRWDYYKEIGYSEEAQHEILVRDGMLEVMRYWKIFEIHAVERVLEEHKNCVIDFGVSHSVYEDDTLFERAKCALAPYDNVILLLPSPDLDESIEILRGGKSKGKLEGFDLHHYFVRHHANHALAKHTVYTKGKTPVETCTEIIEMCLLPYLSAIYPCMEKAINEMA